VTFDSLAGGAGRRHGAAHRRVQRETATVRPRARKKADPVQP